jgi:DnaK suppressor protein
MRPEKSWKTRKADRSEILRRRRILETERQEAMRALERLGDETRDVEPDGPKDVADICTENLSREALFQQRADRQLKVRMTESALARIEQGTFGVCVACGDHINSRRLDALPWTQYCLRCQQEFEKEEKLNNQSHAVDRLATLKKAG